jgi:hypothetical protein
MSSARMRRMLGFKFAATFVVPPVVPLVAPTAVAAGLVGDLSGGGEPAAALVKSSVRKGAAGNSEAL